MTGKNDTDYIVIDKKACGLEYISGFIQQMSLDIN